MTATKNVYVLMLALVIVLSGCFGNSTDPVDADDDDSDDDANWINDRGTGNDSWTLSLDDDEWLEVKSSQAIMQRSHGGNQSEVDQFQYGMTIIEDDGWLVGGHSPIFGGEYSMCMLYIEGNCYSEDPEGDVDLEIDQWSVIYRIHEV